MGAKPGFWSEPVERMCWCTEAVARRWANNAQLRKRSSGMKDLPAASSREKSLRF